MKSVVAIAVLVGLGACTTLGPMAATTAISAVPANRGGVEVQAGIVPGFMLSDAANATHAGRGRPVGELSGIVEPGASIGLPGLIIGARRVGDEGNTVVEPFVGVRRQVDPAIALAAIAFGTRGQGESMHASYEATRVGGEVAADATLLASRWVELHAQAAVSLTGLWASGRYCVDQRGDGVDCSGDATDTVVDANLTGAYLAGTTGLSLELFRGRASVVHVVRLAGMLTVGAMPRVRDGKQEAGDPYVSGGLTLTLGLGQARY